FVSRVVPSCDESLRRLTRSQGLEELSEIGFLRRTQAEGQERVVMVDDVGERCEAPIVIEAAPGMCEQTLERWRSIPLVGCAIGLEGIDADLGRRVHVPAWLSVEWRHVTGAAASRAFEEGLATCGCGRIEARCGRCGRDNRELVEVQCRELRRDEIGRR